MYLVPAEHFEHRRPKSQTLPQPPPPPPPPLKSRPSVKSKSVTKKMKKNVTLHPHGKWVALRTKLLEADVKELELISRFADFLREVLPQFRTRRHSTNETRPKIETLGIAETPQRSPIATQTEPPFVREVSAIYEVSNRRLSSSSDDVEPSDDDDDKRGV